ncbi:MAG: DUF3137 domain-containing protein [Lentisphaeria bacterium]|nr:DUF3137 domain-containing protein [Lentisphaeria bacterium]
MNATDPDRSPDGHSRTIAGLNESLAELRELRDTTRKKALTGGIAIFAVSVVITLAVAAAANSFLPFILILGIVLAVSAYVGMMHGVKLKYKKLVVPSLLKDIDPGLAYNPSGCIPKEEFRRSKIFSNTPSSYTGEDLVFGTYKGIPVRFSELKVQEKHSDGKNTTYHTFFQGVFLIADFNKDFKYSHWVLPDTAEAAFGQVVGNFLQKISLPGRGHMTRMEDPAFEKKFVVYTENDVEARYILSPKLMRTMLALSERFRKGVSRIAFAFMDSSVYIAIPIESGRDLFEMPSRGDMGEETARRTQEELKEILSVFDVMELDLRLWSKDRPYSQRQ